MTIHILKAGLLTTVQDLGRPGYQKDGVTAGGAMDRWSMRIANYLVGNSEGEAVLEMTINGPTLLFHDDTLIAITGCPISSSVNEQPLPMWRPILIKQGSVLTFKASGRGRLAYIAVAGGIQVPEILKSKSTYIGAHLGGYKGRALIAGDCIETGKPTSLSLRIIDELASSYQAAFIPSHSSISPSLLPKFGKEIDVCVLPGPEMSQFSEESLDRFYSSPFTVSVESNRMGYRLSGQKLLYNPFDMLSSPVTFGTIQVPADGNPIILMADCQTTGGYPRIAHVIQADLPRLAQAAPGNTLRFFQTTLNSAYKKWLEQEKQLRCIQKTIQMRWK